MKIKQLKWKKCFSEDRSGFWYESNTPIPMQYVIETAQQGAGWMLWLNDVKLGRHPSSSTAMKHGQKHFERTVNKLLER